MKKRKKMIIVAAAAAALVGLAFPLSNLVVGAPAGTTVTTMAGGDALREPVAPVLEAKCANCHTAEPVMPFYASFPVASTLVREDMTLGRRYFDIVEGLFPEKGAPPTEPALAMIEHVVQEGSMPPGRYLALHWDGSLSAEEKTTLVAWVHRTRAEHHAPRGLPEKLAAAVIHPIPEAPQTDPKKVALGKLLYNDKRLSGDDTISCASCHDLTKGGTDQARVSTGIRGQQGPINAPTTFNALWQVKQFWDGRAATLQEQAGGPPLNPVEMGATWKGIIAKLEADEALAAQFKDVYPAGFSEETITDAIAEFERTLVTPDAPLDRFLKGDAGALTAEQKEGWAVFQAQGCHTCHTGRLLGGGSFELMGRAADYFKARGGELAEVDAGRYAVTKKERDRHRFKVPTLRNVALTFPYFHDGQAKTLADATRAMAKFQNGRDLTETEVKAVVAFMNSLTGTYQGKPL